MQTPPNNGRILIIDDDEAICYSLKRVLSARGFAVKTAKSGQEGLDLAGAEDFEVIFLDNRMEGMDGLETLQHIKSAKPQSMVIFMTAYGTTQTAIEAIKYGAYDYIIKPFAGDRVCDLAAAAAEDRRENLRLGGDETRSLLQGDDYREGLVGDSEPMQRVIKTIGKVAASDATVLITGESGTGKELVARCLYKYSGRSSRPFIPINCAAIPENLIESELFGHEMGAFTGAVQKHVGKFEQCDGGTIFLDEIGDMSPAAQVRILRVLQEGEIQHVGGSETINVDVRIIAATNKRLEEAVKKGHFREDLYYRLNVVPIQMPPLRERITDIPPIVDFFLQKMAGTPGIGARRISLDAQRKLLAYHWPGNVRELENVIQRSAIVAQGETILLKDLPCELQPAPTTPDSIEKLSEAAAVSNPEPPPSIIPEPDPLPIVIGGAVPPNSMSPNETFDLVYRQIRENDNQAILLRIEREMISRALRETGGNQVKASQLLGMARVTLRKRINEYEIRY